MIIPVELVFAIVFGLFLVKFIFSFGSISVAKMLNLSHLAEMGTKFLGYKELFDIATGNNKNDYGDLFDNVAHHMLNKDGK